MGKGTQILCNRLWFLFFVHFSEREAEILFEFFRKSRVKMCFYKNVNGETVLCCPEKTCINVVIKACQQATAGPQDPGVQHDYTWIMLLLPIFLVMLLVLVKKWL